MRYSANISVAASQSILGAEPNATRVRLKIGQDGALMFMPTARVAVNNLPKEEFKARKLTRDARKNTLSVAVNVPDVAPGVYVLTPGKFKWFSMTPWVGEQLPPLGTLSVRLSKKSG